MQDLDFRDETLDINITESYHLSIQACLNGFSFAVLDTITNKFIVLSHHAFNQSLPASDIYKQIDDLVTGDELLAKKFKSVHAIWLGRKVTLIPAECFAGENLKSYFELNHRLDELDELHHREIDSIQAFAAYTIPNEFAVSITKQYNNVRFFNQVNPFIEKILERQKVSFEKNKAFLQVNEDFIDVVILENKNLIFYNNFFWQDKNDLLFYMLTVFKQLNLQPKECELVISGIIHTRSDLVLQLKRVFKTVAFEKPDPAHIYSYTFEQIEPHTFTNLFYLNNCE